MRASLVLIGDELLNGSVNDTALVWIGERLAANGFDLGHVQFVGDDLASISDGIGVAVSRGDAVILTGGLGPTSDDLTRNALARFIRVPLLRDRDLLELIAARYDELDRSMPDNAASMADLPEGATALLNQTGSAPGIRVMIDGVPIFALPGVPSEMRSMFIHEVLPELRRTFSAESRITIVLRVAIEGESTIAMKLRNWERDLPSALSVAYLAELGDVLVKISGNNQMLASEYAKSAAQLIGDSVYAIQDAAGQPILIATQVHRLLSERSQTIATAESLTGGGVGTALTQIPGSSANYLGGVIAYSPSLKMNLLGVSSALIAEVGTVDPQVASAMALGVRRATGADWALATTGVAGPGDSEGIAQGTVYVALVGPGKEAEPTLNYTVIRLKFGQLDRDFVRRAAVIHALELVRRTLSGLGMAADQQDVTHLCRLGEE